MQNMVEKRKESREVQGIKADGLKFSLQTMKLMHFESKYTYLDILV